VSGVPRGHRLAFEIHCGRYWTKPSVLMLAGAREAIADLGGTA
jgi:hypothetical protein